MGPLFARTVPHKGYPWLKVWAGYPYSVSRVNQIVSLFVMLVWLALSIGAFPALQGKLCLPTVLPWAFASLTAIFAIAMLLQKSRRIY